MWNAVLLGGGCLHRTGLGMSCLIAVIATDLTAAAQSDDRPHTTTSTQVEASLHPAISPIPVLRQVKTLSAASRSLSNLLDNAGNKDIIIKDSDQKKYFNKMLPEIEYPFIVNKKK